jgi:hypothetical protein
MVQHDETFGAGRKYGFRARTFVQEILVPTPFGSTRVPAAMGSGLSDFEVPRVDFDEVPQLQHPPSGFVPS